MELGIVFNTRRERDPVEHSEVDCVEYDVWSEILQEDVTDFTCLMRLQWGHH
jgi:hypothetical protein